MQNLDQFQLPPNFRGRSAFTVQLWWLVQGTLFACSPQFMYGWRRFLLRAFGANIGRNVLLRPGVKTTYPWKLSIGDNAWIGDDVTLYTLGEIVIGRNAVVSQKSYLCTGSHDYRAPAFDIYTRPIHVGEEAWVSADVFIAPGVSIGKGAVIGARSTVLEDMPENMICAGYPARPLKPRA